MKPKKITKKVAEEFFAALEENEEHMGEGAALALTLEEFGYQNDEHDVMVEMAMALDDYPLSLTGQTETVVRRSQCKALPDDGQ